MSKITNHDIITESQKDFYDNHKKELIDKYLKTFPKYIDPDVVRDLFMPIGYNRSNVQDFQTGL